MYYCPMTNNIMVNLVCYCMLCYKMNSLFPVSRLGMQTEGGTSNLEERNSSSLLQWLLSK